MADVAHSSLTGSNLHENKGVSAASDNTVATASSGATVWQKLTHNHLTTTGNPFGAHLLHVRNEQNQNTNGGSLTTSTWTTRVLNTTKTNEITSASLSSNQIILPAGTYHIKAVGLVEPSNSSITCFIQSRFYNITSSTPLVIGMGKKVTTAVVGVQSTPTCWDSVVEGRFTLAGSTTCAFQSYVTSSTASEGTANNITTEVYSDVLIWKIA